MQYAPETPRTGRKIGGKLADGTELAFTVQVPQPFAPGEHILTEGEASALNQVIAENLSNNLRVRFLDGKPAVEADPANKIKAEPARPWTPEEAQAMVDGYLAEYEIGVRRTGTGEARVSDPVEREARKIARAKAVDFVKSQGGKPADFDMGPITEAVFTANRDVLMAEGAKIVAAMEAARAQSSALSTEGLVLPTPAPAGEQAAEAPAE